jgi:hypothetical protein
MKQYEGKPRIVKESDGYRIVGTAYGYMWTTHGSIATWRTYSGAYKALKRCYS